MKLVVPELSLVALIGASGSGKSTFARTHFKPTEVLSSDFCRGLVSDDENDQSSSDDAFQVLYYLAAKRLRRGRLTVVDATNVQAEDRRRIVELAREYHSLPVAIVFNLPENICHERNRTRQDRDFGPHVVRRQATSLRRSLRNLKREGFRYVHVLSSVEEIEKASIERQPLWNNLKSEHGPFDIIGDVHGCLEELKGMLRLLGYEESVGAMEHRGGRKAIFLGDLVDRGPDSPGVLRFVMNMVREGCALCVPGNHDIKLLKKLRGRSVRLTHGLEKTLMQLGSEPQAFLQQVSAFLDGLVSHYVLDDGKLVVAHGGMKEELQGRGSEKVREFALYGETTGETDEFGLPVRWNWAAEYRGRAMVVYGHAPVPECDWLNRTINIDTGCVFGGKLTALRYPEREIVSVPALHAYCEPVRPLGATRPLLTAQQAHDDLLDMEDVSGKRIISTRLYRSITIREENASAALEAMSRFAVDPRWLIYLPPTMSPCETSSEEGFLEHPDEAFAYYRKNDVSRVVCEEKHMGSRAVIVVCRDEESARARFGAVGMGSGVCYTRTGRRFFNDGALEEGLMSGLRAAFERSGFWDERKTDWVCLDCEIMPWSVKAQDLLKTQYAAVGISSRLAIAAALDALEQAERAGVGVSGLLERFREKRALAAKFVDAYRQYCWDVSSLSQIKVAPFHLLATEGAVHVDKSHIWHMESLEKIVAGNPDLLVATPYREISPDDEESIKDGAAWWNDLTSRGGEGMVVKPLDFIARGQRGLLQPAVKCRGPEYLRIIYGLEYTMPENLQRLRSRGLSTKRALAMREFALGVEALERFVAREPLRRVHECVFGILALESEPVDPRL